MRIIECDRCHKRFNKDAKKTGYVNLDQRDIKTGGLDGNSEFDDWDICPDCMEKIREFVRKVPPKAEKPEGEKPKATIRKPVTGMALSQEKIDMIKQMAQDGKTVKEICDYTGVSEPTVRKYKKEVTNETTEPVTESVSED